MDYYAEYEEVPVIKDEKSITPTQIEDRSMEMMNSNTDVLLAIAEEADKRVEAINKIMAAARKVTTERDWCIIGGTPYLQETGASKVCTLFGVSTKILGCSCVTDAEGYPTYTYRMSFSFKGQSIEAEGSRSAKDEFFAGKRTDKDGKPKEQKKPDVIPMRDVKQSAYTNCVNNGIKRLLPGLRGLTLDDLEKAGFNINKIPGYTFKKGTQGGNTGTAETSGLVCSKCGAPITQAEASYSEGKFGAMLCRKCQKEAAASK